MTRGSAALLLFCQAVAWAIAFSPAGPTLEVSTLDSSGHAVPGVAVVLKVGDGVIATAQTDASGHAEFVDMKPGRYEITATKAGFEATGKKNLEITEKPPPLVELVMVASLTRKESIEVTDKATQVDQSATTSNSLTAETAKDLPGRPATVTDALPLLPGVIRRPDGGLQISASGEHRSALIVNSADVTDPATGQFGLTVPIDIVDTMNVFQTPFLAEYGRFSAGLVSVETRRGGQKWHWEINDPFPDFYIRSWHLRGLRDATPRLNVDGPLIPGKLYFSEGLEYDVRKIEIITLPFPNDQKRTAGFNSFAQFDWVQSEKNLVTLTTHVAPERQQFVNLDYFNPPSTTPDASIHNYTATLADRYTLLGGVLETTFSATQFGARVWGQGQADMIITPYGNAGNYFSDLDRTATRYSWSPSYALPALNWKGVHNIKVGFYAAQSDNHGARSERPVDILNAQYQLTEQITFTAPRSYAIEDTEYAVYAQDHWNLSSRLALDLGVRVESQEVSQSFRVAPRVGIAWTPFASTGTVIRAGAGFFYDHVPLNVYTFNHYPREIETFFGPSGAITAGPYIFGNALAQVDVSIPFVFRHQADGNFSPQTATGSVQLEQPISRRLKLRVGYMQSQSAGLVYLDQVPPDPATGIGANELVGSGQARYRQVEATARLKLKESSDLFFSYVNSHARGDLNDFNNYLGSFPIPLIRPNQFSNLAGDIPNRFLAWGTIKLPLRFLISPMLELRNGFPYFITDAAQNYVGVPNQNRYPLFAALDSRLSKDIQVTPKYAVRLSVSGFNLSNHFNPESFHNNIADPAYGVFFGQRQRRFTFDFDVLF
ncbi:MAG: TonB-dependent receptor [Candidatus Sulfopaludibacter sp.]|nr:TonB-dependent receptor [Candidatus Sulfopaludibacter sp.]